jgi:hypothetical protein
MQTDTTTPVGRRAHFDAEHASLTATIAQDEQLLGGEVEAEALAVMGDRSAQDTLKAIAQARERLPQLRHRHAIVTSVLDRLSSLELTERARDAAAGATKDRPAYLAAVATFKAALLAAVAAGQDVVAMGRRFEAERMPVERARDLGLSDAEFPVGCHELELWRHVAGILKHTAPSDGSLNRPSLFLRACDAVDLPVAKGRK